jgi:hypothetical protein
MDRGAKMTHPTYPLRQLSLDDYRIDGIDR